jgi:hypothetical protein
MTPKQYKLHLLNCGALLDLLRDGAKLSTDIKMQYSDINVNPMRQDVSEKFPDLTLEAYIDAIHDAKLLRNFTHFAFIQRPKLCDAIPEYYDLSHTGSLPKIYDGYGIDFYLFINLAPDTAELLAKRHDLELWA